MEEELLALTHVVERRCHEIRGHYARTEWEAMQPRVCRTTEYDTADLAELVGRLALGLRHLIESRRKGKDV